MEIIGARLNFVVFAYIEKLCQILSKNSVYATNQTNTHCVTHREFNKHILDSCAHKCYGMNFTFPIYLLFSVYLTLES